MISRTLKRQKLTIKKINYSKINYSKMNDFNHLSLNSLSIVFSFLEGNEILEIKTISKEFETIFKNYNLENTAFKYKLEYLFPRMSEVLSYYNFEKINWIDLYSKRNQMKFHKKILTLMLNYQCDNILVSKPLVISIYNACFDICICKDDQSDFCYLTIYDILKKNTMEIRQKLMKNTHNQMTMYKKEKEKYIKTSLWICKSMMYLERFFIPNSQRLPIKILAKILFVGNVINHFEIKDNIVIGNSEEIIDIENYNIDALINEFT